MSRLTLWALAWTLTVSCLAAQSTQTDWSVVSGLHAGTPVEVVFGNLKRAAGPVVEAADDHLTLQTAGGPTRIARSDVRRVNVTSRSRGKRAILGLAIGAGAGAAIAAIAVNAKDIDLRYDLSIGVPMVLGGAIGAGVGAATGGPRTVYRAP
ncbi:MAG: hypothetical protein JNN08_21720 [Bryobacterales bacterium]|nr:hypothetical protein [Bryobacterales bacterium]